MSPLRDVLVDRPRILFVGINPSLRSEEVGHHFAGPGNPFWRLLHASGLVPEPLAAADDARLAEHGFALTNLCPRASRSAAELGPEEIRRGVEALRDKVERLRPAVVAFVGLSIHRAAMGKASTPGAGAKAERFAGARVFVLPNPSGLNASFPGFADKLVWFERLKAFAAGDDLPGAAPARRRAPRRRSGA